MKKIIFIILVSIFYSKAYAFEIKTNFSNGMPIPKEHACKKKGGKDLSIPVEFINIQKIQDAAIQENLLKIAFQKMKE